MSAGFRQGLRRMPWVMDPLTQLSSGYPFFFPQTPEQNKALMFQTAPGSPLPGGPVTPGLQPFGSQSGGGGFDLPGLLASLTPEQKNQLLMLLQQGSDTAGGNPSPAWPMTQMTDNTPVDKEALAREARSVLDNIAFRRAVRPSSIARSRRCSARKDDDSAAPADHVLVVRGIVRCWRWRSTTSRRNDQEPSPKRLLPWVKTATTRPPAGLQNL